MTGAQGAGLPNPSGQPAPPADGNGAASTLPATSPGGAADQSAVAPGSASSFGAGQTPSGQALQQAPAQFNVPGFYGQGPQTFTVGEGRLARPKFRFSGNISQGYDDNVFQTPTHPQGIPAQKVQVEIAPGTPASSYEVEVPSGDPTIPSTTEAVNVPATKPQFRTVTIPAVPAQQRVESWVTRTDGKFDMQFASRRTLFTFDLGAGVDYYWNQPGTKAEYNGNLALIYLHKFSGRTQFTVNVNSSYQTQPNFAVPNEPTSSNVGSYLTTNIKADLSNRLTPRFSTVTSVSYSDLNYEESSQAANNYYSMTLGTQLRYLSSPRLTLVGETRYSFSTYANTPADDTTSYFLLVGGDLNLSRRFTASLRVGEEVETFKDTNSSAGAPYGEATLNYRFSTGTNASWNTRYGYEESGSSDYRNLVARSGLQLTQIFSPRLQGSLGVNLVRSSTSTPTVSAATTTTTSTAIPLTLPSTVQDTIDAEMGFYYTLDRHWSFNLTYSYTMLDVAPATTQDYFRSRIFLGASYQF